jgi:drug/metabolite transporter (DMT)-like permease
MLDGVAAAVAAALLFSLSMVLQKREAEQVARGGVWILASLARRPAWLLALALQLAGFALQSWALTRAPVTVVEPVVAGGLVFVVLFALLVLRERPGRQELSGTLLLALGLGLLVSNFQTVSAFRRVSEHDLGLATAAALGLTLLLVALARAPFANRAALLLGTAAGVGQGMSDAMNRLAGAWWEPRAGWIPPRSMGWLATALLAFFGLIGLVVAQNALRRYRANSVVPCILGAQVVIPIAVASALFGERMPDAPVALGAAAFLTVAGLGLLGTSRTIASTLAANAAP